MVDMFYSYEYVHLSKYLSIHIIIIQGTTRQKYVCISWNWNYSNCSISENIIVVTLIEEMCCCFWKTTSTLIVLTKVISAQVGIQ